MTYPSTRCARWGVWLILAVIPLMVALPASATIPKEEGIPFNVLSIDTKMKIHGVIDRIQGNVLFAKTPWGRYALGTTKQFRNLAVGDEVILYVNGDNVVVDVHRKGAPAPRHRWLTGFLRYTSPAKNEIALWTEDGWKNFTVDPKAIARLNAIPEGKPITVQLNEDGRVIDVVRLDISIDVTKPYAIEKGGYMEVSGIVTDIRGPLIFVDTPVGQMTVANVAKAKLVKPGETVFLRLDEKYTVVDVHKPREAAFTHRYITGKLAYTDTAQAAIRLETPEGIKVFPLSEAHQQALASLRKGELITV
ncbi:MAG: hypothetical protein D6690_05435, partial [Nitrospirae bacterium]